MATETMVCLRRALDSTSWTTSMHQLAYETWAMYAVADVSKRLEEIQLLQTFAWYFSSLFAMTDAIECFKQI